MKVGISLDLKGGFPGVECPVGLVALAGGECAVDDLVAIHGDAPDDVAGNVVGGAEVALGVVDYKPFAVEVEIDPAADDTVVAGLKDDVSCGDGVSRFGLHFDVVGLNALTPKNEGRRIRGR